VKYSNLKNIQYVVQDVPRKTIKVISEDIAFSGRYFKGRLSEQEAGFCPFVSDFRSDPLLASDVGAYD
jgi:hypothetical protein